MKKGILLIASAAALILGSNNASAAAPTWYNFQGVCALQNATVGVQFDIVDADGNVVYSESHANVQTNPSGIFTCHVGQGEVLEGQAMPDAGLLNRGGLTLVTSVNGAAISHAAFGAVPYASQAASLGYFTVTDMVNLQETVEVFQTQLGDLDDAVYEISNDVQGIQEVLRGKASVEKVAEIDDAVYEISNDVQGIQESLRGKATLTFINDNFVSNEALDASMANFQENLENALKAYVTTEDLDASMENFQENIDNALAAYVTTEDLDASMENFMENIDNVYVSKETYEELVGNLDDVIGSVSRNANNITDLQSKVIENQNDIDDLQGQVLELGENVRANYVPFYVFNNKVEELTKQITLLSQEIADLK